MNDKQKKEMLKVVNEYITRKEHKKEEKKRKKQQKIILLILSHLFSLFLGYGWAFYHYVAL